MVIDAGSVSPVRSPVQLSKLQPIAGVAGQLHDVAEMIRARIVAANAAIAHCRNGQRILGEQCGHTPVPIDGD